MGHPGGLGAATLGYQGHEGTGLTAIDGLRGAGIPPPGLATGATCINEVIEEPRVVRAIPEHLLLWDEPRPPPGLPAAARAPVELEYLPWVE